MERDRETFSPSQMTTTTRTALAHVLEPATPSTHATLCCLTGLAAWSNVGIQSSTLIWHLGVPNGRLIHFAIATSPRPPVLRLVCFGKAVGVIITKQKSFQVTPLFKILTVKIKTLTNNGFQGSAQNELLWIATVPVLLTQVGMFHFGTFAWDSGWNDCTLYVLSAFWKTTFIKKYPWSLSLNRIISPTWSSHPPPLFAYRFSFLIHYNISLLF